MGARPEHHDGRRFDISRGCDRRRRARLQRDGARAALDHRRPGPDHCFPSASSWRTWRAARARMRSTICTARSARCSFRSSSRGSAIASTHPPLPLPDDIPAVQQHAAHATHWALYALLMVQPFVGWIATSAYRAPIMVFGLFELPPIWPQDRALSDQLFLGAPVDRCRHCGLCDGAYRVPRSIIISCAATASSCA